MFTVLAGDTNFEGNPITGPETKSPVGGTREDVGTDCHDGPARLVAESEGLADQDVAVGVVVEVVQIRAAEASGLDKHLDLIRARRREILLFLWSVTVRRCGSEIWGGRGLGFGLWAYNAEVPDSVEGRGPDSYG